MKQNIFKYIAIAACLFGAAMTALAQYHEEGDMKTAKNVEGPDEDGLYTITLEAFATGSTTVTEEPLPADIALVLDLSTSMKAKRGDLNRTGKALSYNDVVNARKPEENYLWYGNDSQGDTYSQLFGETVTVGGQTRYYLYINKGGGSNDKYYIKTDGTRTSSNARNDAAYATNPDAAIVTFSANGRLYTGSSRIFALKHAVDGFLNTIEEEDITDDGRVGHKISIISFESDTQVYQSLDFVENINLEELKAKVWAFTLRTGTQPSEGIDVGNTQLTSYGHSGVIGEDFARTLVLFTDGEPFDSPKYQAVKTAYTSKNTNQTLVYAVGMFNSSPSSTSNEFIFLNAVSSNYPEANLNNQNNIVLGEGNDQGYYKDASGTVDLTAIFEEIAHGAGGATRPIGPSTQVRDVVSNSFVIPEGYDPDDVDVYTCAATGETSWSETLVPFNASVNFYDVDKDGKRVGVDQGAGEKTNRAIVIEGFDFSKDDTQQGVGDGNWVGQRFSTSHTPNYFWAGKKLVIKLSIKANGEATGGTGTATNASTSGVYLKNEDGTFTRINQFDQPHTTLTTTLKIKKKGLRSGQSATFEIMKIRPKGWSATATEEQNLKNMEYNIIGKPIPNQHDPEGSVVGLTGSDLYKKMGWEPFSKVIVTNKSKVDGAEVTKVLRALDPFWVYMVLEDDWGWAYEMSGSNPGDAVTGEPTTSMVEINPFKFENKEKKDAVKHAEAVTINHFQGTNSSSREEHYKSSKVESFTNPK